MKIFYYENTANYINLAYFGEFSTRTKKYNSTSTSFGAWDVHATDPLSCPRDIMNTVAQAIL
jgi:hypothetical protein